jgi:hypothetical protein
MKINIRVSTAAFFTCLCAGALAQSSYDSEAAWLGGTAGTFGKGFFPTFGQTFNAPVDGYNTLVDFSFWVAGANSDGFASETDTFMAQVYQWDGSEPTGSALFSQNIGPQTCGPNFTQVEVETSVAMTPGEQYCAMLTDTTQTSYFDVEWLNFHPAGDGGGYLMYNNGFWQSDPTGDYGWHADFTAPAPEPVSIVGLAIGAAGLVARRRSKARAARQLHVD